MTVSSYQVTLSANGASPVVAGKSDALAQANTALTDITAALAVTAIAGDAPSTTAVTLVQTDVTALKSTINANVVLLVDNAVVTTKTKLKAALDALRFAVDGSGLAP